ncbi:hypothetical protein HYV86_00390 [Candidatus Woesearchaeota archaeon]|nr:hypothetical protein [Candidatus Woesearchaeota archaeon]
MATFLDVSLLQSVDAIFPALFVFAIVFAVLNKTHALGKNSLGIDAIIAAVAAFMVLLSRPLIELINYIIPWFVVAIIFFLLLLLIFRVFGAEESDIAKYMMEDKAVGWVIIAIALVIIAAGMGKVFGQGLTEQAFEAGTQNGTVTYDENGVATGNFQQSVTATLFHPKVLGVIIIFTIAIFAVALLTGQEAPGKGSGGGDHGGHGH